MKDYDHHFPQDVFILHMVLLSPNQNILVHLVGGAFLISGYLKPFAFSRWSGFSSPVLEVCF